VPNDAGAPCNQWSSGRRCAAFGDPGRLAIVDALVLGEPAPSSAALAGLLDEQPTIDGN
jgi:hypothetical protein